MCKLPWVALALTMASPLHAKATERLVAPTLPGFVAGDCHANAQQSICEEVPRGETVEAWSRMVTTQWFPGLAARATPAQYAREVIAPLPRACPGARVSPMENLTVSSRPAVRFQVDCPRNAGGQPETFILLAIAGPSDMYVKQVAFRGTTTAAGLQWARGFLAATVLCQPKDRQPACQR